MVLGDVLGFGWVGFGAKPDKLAGPFMAWFWCLLIGLMGCGCVSGVGNGWVGGWLV